MFSGLRRKREPHVGGRGSGRAAMRAAPEAMRRRALSCAPTQAVGSHVAAHSDLICCTPAQERGNRAAARFRCEPRHRGVGSMTCRRCAMIADAVSDRRRRTRSPSGARPSAVRVLVLRGRARSGGRAAAAGAGRRDRPPARALVLDLRGATFIDSAVLKELLRARAELAERDVRLVLAGVAPPVRRLLDLTRTSELFEDAPDVRRGRQAAG